MARLRSPCACGCASGAARSPRARRGAPPWPRLPKAEAQGSDGSEAGLPGCTVALRHVGCRRARSLLGSGSSALTAPDVLIAAVSAALRSRAHSWRRSSWFAFRLKQSERTRDAKLACCCSRAARAAESAAASHRRYASGYSGKSGLLCSRAASRSAAARSCAREDILPRHDSSGRRRAAQARGAGSSISRGCTFLRCRIYACSIR